MSDRWNKPSRIHIEKRLRLFVGVDLNVLVGDAFEFERYPHALDKGAKQMRLARQ